MHTLGTLVLALQVQDGAAPLAGTGNVVEILSNTGPVNRIVLGILILLSVVSWAIIVVKALSKEEFQAWLKTRPFTNPAAPAGPAYMP